MIETTLTEQTVKFVHMADGTQEDYDLLEKFEDNFNATLPDRLLDALRHLQHSTSGYQVTRYQHSLQSATRAQRDGKDDDYMVAALLHDIGDILAPYTHGEMVAAIFKPFLPAYLGWIVKFHGLFQLYYYGQYRGVDPNGRDRYKDHPYYANCVEFCEKYDQNCFDPAYDSLPLDFFEPMVRRIFSQPPRFDDDGNR